ncbi:hypothetical protein AVEN_207541-1, partial [Araneus ventricosus]
ARKGATIEMGRVEANSSSPKDVLSLQGGIQLEEASRQFQHESIVLMYELLGH